MPSHRTNPALVMEGKELKQLPYRIRDWVKHFENASSKKLKRLEWVAIPNRVDGSGYCALVDHPNGAAHLGAWLAMVEIASRQKQPRNGTLPDVGGICQSLGRISRLRVEVFKEALPRLIEIGWIESIQSDRDSLPQSADSLADSPTTLGNDGGTIQDITGNNKTLHEREEQKPYTPAPENPALVLDPACSVRSFVAASKKKRTSEELRSALGERLPWWDALWAIYPCRDGMKAGLDAFERRVHDRDLAVEIFHGAEKYAAKAKADPTMKLKYLQGWLNDERWKDENVIQANGTGKGSTVQRAIAEMEQRIRNGERPL